MFKDAVTAVAADVFRYIPVRVQRKANAWWADGIKETIKGKRLLRNVAKETSVRRTKYKSWNRKVKELVKESKRKVDEEFCIKLSEKFNENKKQFL